MQESMLGEAYGWGGWVAFDWPRRLFISHGTVQEYLNRNLISRGQLTMPSINKFRTESFSNVDPTS